MVGSISLKNFSLLNRIFFIKLIFFILKLHSYITFRKVEGILLMLACQHLVAGFIQLFHS